MGKSTISHGKRVDKGTHTPLLKIFQDIMTKETDDPEKRNLLIEQKEDKKRRHYSGSRSKPECRSCASSITEHRKRGPIFKSSSTEQRAEYHQNRTHSMPYQSEKKDSWWFWQNQNEKKQNDDTCSCVSCALKKLVGSEYACIGCLLILFTISIIVAFLVVFKSVPGMCGTTTECPEPTTTKPPCTTKKTTTTSSNCCNKICDSERLKRKIEMLNDNRFRSDLSGLDEYRKDNKKGYDDALSGHVGIPGSSGIDFGPSFRELNSLDEHDNRLSSEFDWNSILDTDKMDTPQTNDRLREFYKKLVQTDAKIKSLKTIQDPSYFGNMDDLQSPERSKRSLKLSLPKTYVIRGRRSPLHKTGHILENKQSNKTRIKRINDDIEDPTGFVIEKKKLIVQYKPNVNNKLPVKKCSHAPKDSNTHENQLKHPFYQNTQRLDELLDRFLNKNLPEMMADPFGLDLLFKQNKEKECKHSVPAKNVNILPEIRQYTPDVAGRKDQLVNQIPKPKTKFSKVNDEQKLGSKDSNILDMLKPENEIPSATSTNQYEKAFYHHEAQMIGEEKLKIVTASPNDFEVLLSVSTIMNQKKRCECRGTSKPREGRNPDIKKIGNAPTPGGTMLAQVPNLRRLMQIETEDDENLGYEDFKEVLTDDMDNHDDMEKPGDRRKRKDDDQSLPGDRDKFPKINPPGVHNPNWKGPMPLYPDEMNSMQHSAVNSNKVEFPIVRTDTSLQQDFLERGARDLSDVDYVEDYLGMKYDKLVKMAQAYSDYGVLDDKKDSRNEKNTATEASDHRVKLSAYGNIFNNGLFGKLKKGRLPNVVNKAARRENTGQTDLADQYGGLEGITLTPGCQEETEQTTEQAGGIRIEFRPTSLKEKPEDLEVLKILQKHIRLQSKFKQPKKPAAAKARTSTRSTLSNSYPNMELLISSAKEPLQTGKLDSSKDTYKNKDHEHGQDNGFFGFKFKGTRNLLSTDDKRTVTLLHPSMDGSGDYMGEGTEKTQFGTTFRDLYYENVNGSNEKALARYMEYSKRKYIRIYSTAHPFLNDLTINSSNNVINDDIQGNILSTFMTPSMNYTFTPTMNSSPMNFTTMDSFSMTSSTMKSPTTNSPTMNSPTKKPSSMSSPSMNSADMHSSTKNSSTKNSPTMSSPSMNSPTMSSPSMNPPTMDSPTMVSPNMNSPTMDSASMISNIDTINSNDSGIRVTINKSEIRTDYIHGDNFQGRIRLTVENPDMGVENIDLKFDVPVVMDLNGELMMMSDSMRYPNVYNQFEIFTEHTTTSDPNDTNTFVTPDFNAEPKNGTVVKRTKRDTNSSDNVYNTTATPVIMPANVMHNGSEIPNATVKHDHPMKKSDTEMSLSDFFMMVSDWFKALEDVKVDKPRESTGSELADALMKENRPAKNGSTEPFYPSYDSDMIENIGHRSRVLLSIENLSNATAERIDEIGAFEARERRANGTDGNVVNVTNSSSTQASLRFNMTTLKNNTDKRSDEISRENNKSKAIFKRSADENSNLIFWNDMYDDEYGIQTDKLDSPIRDKHSVKDKDFIKRSGRWVHDKIRKFAENLKLNPRPEDVSIKERVPRSIRNPNIATYPKYIYNRIYNRLGKRDPEDVYDDDYDPEEKSIFSALSENMKNVCKKAARAVQQTRNIEVREDTKQGTIAASLMQQLVRLLTDLIDYQVQQKTCTQLPPELQNFLEWLMFKKDEPLEAQKEGLTFKTPFQDDDIIDELERIGNDHSQDFVAPLTAKPTGVGLDVRLHFVECLHSIEDLLEQYEEIPDEDKSKMTGVKNYLDDQMSYLNKQLSAYDLYNLFEKHNRYKRELQRKNFRPKRRLRRRQHKFIKNFGKKHTRTTASFVDSFLVTDKKRTVDKNEETNTKVAQDVNENVLKNVKRNLKDVYYKAIAEAKKYATVKNMHKKEEMTKFGSTTAAKLS